MFGDLVEYAAQYYKAIVHYISIRTINNLSLLMLVLSLFYFSSIVCIEIYK